jgi:3-oxoacyl-(acyl-carrier-protein) synthase
VNVHGTGTQQNDAAEWQAIRAVFGPRCTTIPITATKSLIGHLLGASGAVEAVATALCIDHELLPGAPGGGPVDPETPADLVLGEPRPVPGVRTGLSTNLAFGGANSVIVMTADP